MSSYPGYFEFKLKPPTIVQHIVWMLTRVGQLKLKLWKAFQKQNSPKIQESLVYRLNKFRSSEAMLNAAANQVIFDILLYLTWLNLKKELLGDAAQWLVQLDSEFPNSKDRISLRWMLLEELLSTQDFIQYEVEAQILMEDSFVNPSIHMDAVLEVTKSLYEYLSPKKCASSILKSHKLLRETSQLKASLALCKCPKRFQTLDTANIWKTKLEPGELSFSTKMQKDAIHILTHVAEWQKDWKKMSTLAGKAKEIDPLHPLSRYWVIRASLYSNDKSISANIILSDLESSNWKRLSILVSLHENPNLVIARKATQILQGEYGEPDVLERQLTLEFLKTVLQADAAMSDSDIAECGGLCKIVQTTDRDFPWTDITIALKEIRVDHDYIGAKKRLENKEILPQEDAKLLWCTAGILAGSVQIPMSGKFSECFTDMGSAMCRILGMQKEDILKANDHVLINHLQKYLEDDWVKLFPDLIGALNVLVLALQVFERPDLPQLKSPLFELLDHPARWVRYLFCHTCLIICGEKSDSDTLLKLRSADLLIVGLIRFWIIQYTGDNKLLAHHEETVGYSGEGNGVVAINQMFDGVEMGELFSAFIAEEKDLTIEHLTARDLLADGDAPEAVSKFEALVDRFGNNNGLISSLWSPLLRYWYAVSLLHAKDDKAQSILSELFDGPKGSDARAQLAICSIREHNLDLAESHLTGASLQSPGTLYAQALLDARKGNITTARQHLESIQSIFPASDSPYVVDAKRLLASIEERSGHSEQAECIYREILSSYPHDEITSTRLARLLLRKLYEFTQNGQPVPVDDMLEKLITGSGEVSLVDSSLIKDFRLLYDLLTTPEDQLTTYLEQVEKQANAWVQILVYRLLNSKQGNEALPLVSGMQNEVLHTDTEHILVAWGLLNTIGKLCSKQQPSKEEKQAIYQKLHSLKGRMEETGINESSKTSNLWYWFVNKACGLYESKSVEWGIWKLSTSESMAYIPGLWSDNEEQRELVAKQLLNDVTQENRWTEEQQLLISLLSNLAIGNKNAFIAQYKSIEPALEELPVDGIEMWNAAAAIWYERKEWELFFDSELPSLVADLTHPRVRLIFGLAYASIAIKHIKNNDSRKGLSNLQNAQSTLEELLEELPATCTSTDSGKDNDIHAKN